MHATITKPELGHQLKLRFLLNEQVLYIAALLIGLFWFIWFVPDAQRHSRITFMHSSYIDALLVQLQSGGVKRLLITTKHP
jgi:hypothetical protein